MSSSHQREPEGLIADFRSHVKLASDKASLLSFIDQSILRDHVRRNNKSGLESTFTITLEKLSAIHRLETPGLCYVFTGDNLVLLQTDNRTHNVPSSFRLPSFLRALIDKKNRKSMNPRLLSRNNVTKDLFRNFNGINSILLAPMYEPSGALLCLFLMTDAGLLKDSALGGKELQKFFAAVVSQLSIAYSQFLRESQKDNLIILWDLFLMSDLSPSKCFGNLAMMIPSCLPSFGPLKLQRPPEVQILILERSQQTDKPSHLAVRATTGAEPDTTRIAIYNSITGLLVEKAPQEFPYFCDDPTKKKYGKRFKNYLGVGKNKEIKTELAVRLFDKSRFVGVLNLESHLKNAFSVHHIRSVMDLADQIAPMIAVFEERLNQNKLTQYSLGATTARYLDSLASIFRHGIRTPILNLRTDVDFIGASLKKDLPRTLQAINKGSTGLTRGKSQAPLEALVYEVSAATERLNAVRIQIDGFANEFAGNISGFGQLGRTNLCETLDEVVRLTNNSLLQKLPEAIEVKLNCKSTMDAFCSPLIKQYLYCLLHNAVVSIQKRMTKNPENGRISISVSADTSPQKSQERELNERWVVRIRDNGMGVTKEQLAQLREFRFGTRFRSDTGTGYGLFATQRYIGSVGGRIELNGVYEKYFEVLLYLDKYREELHGPLSIEAS